MKHVLLACLCCVLICHFSLAQPFKPATNKQGIDLQFYKNIEFLGFTFFMGYLGPQYEHDMVPMPHGVQKQDWFAYDFALYHKYRSFSANPDLAIIARFAEQHEGSSLGRLLIHLDEFPRQLSGATQMLNSCNLFYKGRRILLPPDRK